ncbi:MAG: YqgE/AlgH family protein [Rickettsiaceae bacterium]|nr:YqgE/AlgH family protein [Rickettsiaceae bacterium]
MIEKNRNISFESLTGKMLVANPYCSFGDIFDKSVIYVATHSEEGAIGLIVNKAISRLGIKKLYRIKDEEISRKQDIEKNILIGGPMDPERSFVIHSADYMKNLTFSQSNSIAVSSSVDVIKDILNGIGPMKSNIVLGYTGWGQNQLEEEIENNYWLIQDADQQIIFGDDDHLKWSIAIEKFGIGHGYFSSQMGHS